MRPKVRPGSRRSARGTRGTARGREGQARYAAASMSSYPVQVPLPATPQAGTQHSFELSYKTIDEFIEHCGVSTTVKGDSVAETVAPNPLSPRIVQLRFTNDSANDNILLSWAIKGAKPGWQQMSYDIELRNMSSGLRGSWHVVSSETERITWPTLPPSPDEVYQVRVRSWPNYTVGVAFAEESRATDWSSPLVISSDHEAARN